MSDVLNKCPTCGIQLGHCRHTSEGQVSIPTRPQPADAPPACSFASATAVGAVKVTIQLTVDSRLADDIRVFHAKAMQGNHEAACLHPMTMRFLSDLPKQIECAASYEQAIAAKAGA